MACIAYNVDQVRHRADAHRIARFLEKLASFSRLILFDKRGTGLSDPVAAPAPLEDRIDDVRAVMDADARWLERDDPIKWRRRESNPRPRSREKKLLQA